MLVLIMRKFTLNIVFDIIEELKNVDTRMRTICPNQPTFLAWAGTWADSHPQDRRYLGLDTGTTRRNRGQARTAAEAFNISVTDFDLSDNE